MSRYTIESSAHPTSPDQGHDTVVDSSPSRKALVKQVLRRLPFVAPALIAPTVLLDACENAGAQPPNTPTAPQATLTALSRSASEIETAQAQRQKAIKGTSTALAMKTKQPTGAGEAMTALAGATQTALAEPTATPKPKIRTPDSSLPPQLKNRHPYLKTAYDKTIQQLGWNMKLPPTWAAGDVQSITLKDGQTENIVKLQDTNKTRGPKGTTFSDYQTITIQTIDVSKYTINPLASEQNFYAFCRGQRQAKIIDLQNEAKDLNRDNYTPDVDFPNSPFDQVRVDGQEACDFSYYEPPFNQTYGIDVYAPLNSNTIIFFSGDSPLNNNPPYLQDAVGEVTGTFSTH